MIHTDSSLYQQLEVDTNYMHNKSEFIKGHCFDTIHLASHTGALKHFFRLTVNTYISSDLLFNSFIDCFCQLHPSKLCAVSASRAGGRSLVLWV